MDLRDILLYAFIFSACLLVAVILIKRFPKEDMLYYGTIFVSKDDDKIMYSLELEGDPELLQYQEQVLFKVKTAIPKGKHE